MTLNELTNQIELELHNDKKLSAGTIESVNNMVNKYKIVRGGSFANKVINLTKLTGLDKALLGTISKMMPGVTPKLREAVMENITVNAQRLFPDNANIYIMNLISHPDELKALIAETEKEQLAMRGGQVNDLIVRVMAAITLIVLLVTVYCGIEYYTNKRNALSKHAPLDNE